MREEVGRKLLEMLFKILLQCGKKKQSILHLCLFLSENSVQVFKIKLHLYQTYLRPLYSCHMNKPQINCVEDIQHQALIARVDAYINIPITLCTVT